MTGEVVATQGRSHMLEAHQGIRRRRPRREAAGSALLRRLHHGRRASATICRCSTAAATCATTSATAWNSSIDEQWHDDIDRFADLDLSRALPRQRPAHSRRPPKSELTAIMHRMGKFSPDDELNCGACGYDTCREHAIAICKELAESEMCLPNTHRPAPHRR